MQVQDKLIIHDAIVIEENLYMWPNVVVILKALASLVAAIGMIGLVFRLQNHIIMFRTRFRANLDVDVIE